MSICDPISPFGWLVYGYIVANECSKKSINFIGICCGAEAHHVRQMSMAIGKKPISMKYVPDMSKHFHHGSDKTLKDVNRKITYWLKL